MTKRHEHIMRAKDDYRPFAENYIIVYYRKWECTYRGCRYHEMRIVNDYELHIKGVVK